MKIKDRKRRVFGIRMYVLLFSKKILCDIKENVYERKVY